MPRSLATSPNDNPWVTNPTVSRMLVLIPWIFFFGAFTGTRSTAIDCPLACIYSVMTFKNGWLNSLSLASPTPDILENSNSFWGM